MTTATGASVLCTSLFISDLKSRRKQSALLEMCRHLAEAGAVRSASLLAETLSLRERHVPSAIGKGMALPNARSVTVRQPRLLVARSSRGIEWAAADDEPVRLVLLVLSPALVSGDMHLDFVARAAMAMRLQRQRQRFAEAENHEAVSALLADVLP